MSCCFYKRKMRKIICLWLVCGLLLGGCSPVHVRERIVKEPERGQMSETREQQEASGDFVTEENRDASTEGAFAGVSGREILERLLADEGFAERVWYNADMDEEDTEEIILQKLEQCEGLTLREPPYGDSTFSLEDLAYVPNLKTLVIDFASWDDSQITDFSPISGLSGLEKLYICYDKDEEIDLSFLGQMKSIKTLYLPNCQLKDISFLEEMPQLERLSLYETPVEDLAVLRKLPDLVELSVGGNQDAANIEAVGTLEKMQDLGLQFCGLEDISFLSNLKELRGVNLNGNYVTDLTPLAELEHLERLGAAHNRLSDITPLKGLTNLFDLSLDENEISDISVLADMTHLRQAGLSENQIQDFSPLADKKELMYAAVFGNPCMDYRPVLEVPVLNIGGVEEPEEGTDLAAAWVEKQYPETGEFVCIDYAEGDINEDGRTDIAFVIEETEAKGNEGEVYDERSRTLFVLLGQEDGSFAEAENTPYIPDKYAGGMRGDPYYGMLFGKGYLALKSGWGSSSGETDMEIYSCEGKALQLTKRIEVSDYTYAQGYDVRETLKDNTWFRYAIAMDNNCMVKVDLADSEHPEHKAFPRLSIFDMSYVIYTQMCETRLSAEEALDSFREAMMPGAVKEELPYEVWQKENYERLKGVELPDYYYVLSGTENYIYYDGLTEQDGEYYHVIYEVDGEKEQTYRVKDSTGEITEEK